MSAPKGNKFSQKGESRMDANIHIRTEQALKSQFNAKCLEKNTSMSEQIIKLIREFVR